MFLGRAGTVYQFDSVLVFSAIHTCQSINMWMWLALTVLANKLIKH